MANNSIDLYVLPALPMPLVLPVECIAAVVDDPELQSMTAAQTNWMKGYVIWQNQHVPVISYSALLRPDQDESNIENAHLVVLNPIPDAARKAFSGLLCFGDVTQQSVQTDIEYDELPKDADRRYIDAVVKIDGQRYIIPKLTALGVAFSYF